MNIWHDINEKRIAPADFVAVIEIPKGSRKKYELDKETGLIMLDRVLHTSMRYPANYGFIPRTLSEDGDPLDVMVLGSESLEPMTLVRCFPIGVLEMTDGGEMDEKIIAVPFKDPYYNTYKDISEFPKHTGDEIVHFMSSYKLLENGNIVVKRIQGRAAAEKLVGTACAEYKKKFGKTQSS